MAFTITVNNDDNHTLTFSKNTLARRNEANVSVTVIVPAAVFALGSFAYIDFILPDGSTYFKGDYDPSGGSFTFTLGSSDTMLSQDGKIGIQFVLRDSDVLPTIVWKSELKYALVGSSADATAQALTGIPAPATFPATFPAANTSIVDAGAYFASPDVEDALQEVGLKNNTQDTNISNIVTAGAANPFTNMPYVGTAPIVESGSNANGSYIKFADGTMECYATLALGSMAITSANGSMFIPAADMVWTFPSAFVSAPVCHGSFSGTGIVAFLSVSSVNTTSLNYLSVNTTSQTQLVTAYLKAVGRWKA